MSHQAIENALTHFAESRFSGGASTLSIEQAERDLELLFPPEYRLFLQRFGSGHVSSEELIGLGGPMHLNVVWLTKQLRSRKATFPKSLIPLRSDGYGNYDCLDTALQDDRAECPVVEWVHDSDASHKWRLLGTSFNDWLLKLLDMISQLDND